MLGQIIIVRLCSQSIKCGTLLAAFLNNCFKKFFSKELPLCVSLPQTMVEIRVCNVFTTTFVEIRVRNVYQYVQEHVQKMTLRIFRKTISRYPMQCLLIYTINEFTTSANQCIMQNTMQCLKTSA